MKVGKGGLAGGGVPGEVEIQLPWRAGRDGGGRTLGLPAGGNELPPISSGCSYFWFSFHSLVSPWLRAEEHGFESSHLEMIGIYKRTQPWGSGSHHPSTTDESHASANLQEFPFPVISQTPSGAGPVSPCPGTCYPWWAWVPRLPSAGHRRTQEGCPLGPRLPPSHLLILCVDLRDSFPSGPPMTSTNSQGHQSEWWKTKPRSLRATASPSLPMD